MSTPKGCTQLSTREDERHDSQLPLRSPRLSPSTGLDLVSTRSNHVQALIFTIFRQVSPTIVSVADTLESRRRIRPRRSTRPRRSIRPRGSSSKHCRLYDIIVVHCLRDCGKTSAPAHRAWSLMYIASKSAHLKEKHRPGP